VLIWSKLKTAPADIATDGVKSIYEKYIYSSSVTSDKGTTIFRPKEYFDQQDKDIYGDQGSPTHNSGVFDVFTQGPLGSLFAAIDKTGRTVNPMPESMKATLRKLGSGSFGYSDIANMKNPLNAMFFAPSANSGGGGGARTAPPVTTGKSISPQDAFNIGVKGIEAARAMNTRASRTSGTSRTSSGIRYHTKVKEVA
jgi:hypothetical protein